MKTYNSYAECKLANPDCEVYESGRIRSEFKSDNVFGDTSWKVSNPSNHLMTVEKFLSDGNLFVDGDVYLEADGSIAKVGEFVSLSQCNKKSTYDNRCHVLKSAALENQNNPNKHPHHDLIVEWAKDTSKVVQYFSELHQKWMSTAKNIPCWDVNVKYRFKPEREFIKVHWYPCIDSYDNTAVYMWVGYGFSLTGDKSPVATLDAIKLVGESLGEIEFGGFE